MSGFLLSYFILHVPRQKNSLWIKRRECLNTATAILGYPPLASRCS